MIAVIFYCLLPLLVHCEYGSFNITTPGPHVIAVKSSGFEINICVNKKQTSKFCYGGKPTGNQGVNCGPNYCGIVASTTETNARVIEYGGASETMESDCIKVIIKENQQKASPSTSTKHGTCTWDREKDGKLVIYTEFDPSSPIEVRYGKYHADEAKLQGNSMILYIVIPMVVGGVILVAVIIFGVCMCKKGKCNKEDVDHEIK
uniref:Uncharacterized protein n=1 Tax=Panagrolaimus sp. JU765 TaxID=591449 RepID=A0AC34QGQ8_9BILA